MVRGVKGRNSTRRLLSLILLGLGIVLLLLVPGILLMLAFAGAKNVELPGTLVIGSAVGGMALVVVGVILRE